MGVRKGVGLLLHVGDHAALSLATHADVIVCSSSDWAERRSYCGCNHSAVEVRYGETTVIIMREFLFAMRSAS